MILAVCSPDSLTLSRSKVILSRIFRTGLSEKLEILTCLNGWQIDSEQ